MSNSATAEASNRTGLGNVRDRFVRLFAGEKEFLGFLLIGFLVAAIFQNTPSIAMWIGFAFAGYSAVANDSIQTLGPFIASNKHQKWWVLWLFIGGVFLLTVTYSFLQYDGDVTYQRLASRGFEVAPTSFSYLQLAAPLVLLILTRMKMPVSTTFLLLSTFATTASSVGAVLTKSLAGWVVAFVAAFLLYGATSKLMKRHFTGTPHFAWRIGQWITTGLLWSVWLMQDAANIAVYLPRQMSWWHFGGFSAVIFLGLGVLFKKGGERIQEVVDEKADVVDVRSATVVTVIYAAVLYYFKIYSQMPMSTTWVFVGLLGGRELAMAMRKTSGVTVKKAAKLMGKDLAYVSIGLVVSLILAYSANDAFRVEINSMFGF